MSGRRFLAAALSVAAVCWFAMSCPPAVAQVTNLQKNQMRSIIETAANEMTAGKNEDQVIQARQRLEDGYRSAREDGSALAYFYAGDAADQLAPLLGPGLRGDDPLRQLRMVNAALALSQMNQVSAQAALQQMVGHESPAVRLYGWRGYRRTRRQILAYGGQAAERFFKTVQQRAGAETNVTVLGGFFRMLDLGVAMGPGIDPETWQAWRKVERGVLEDNWDTWCAMLLEENTEMALAALPLMSVAQGHILEIQQEMRRQGAAKEAIDQAISPLLDLLYKLGWHSTLAYKQAGHGSRVANAHGYLLRQWEQGLNGLLGTDHAFLLRAITRAVYGTMELTGDDRYETAVRLSVIGADGWFGVLNAYGVEQVKAPAELPAERGGNENAGEASERPTTRPTQPAAAEG